MIPRTKGLQLSLTRFSPTANRLGPMQKSNSSMRPIEQALSSPDSPILPSGGRGFGRQVFLRKARFWRFLPFDQPPRKCYKTNTLFNDSSYAQRAAKRPAG